MNFLQFIRLKGFTSKSLADKAGVSVRTLDCYTRKKSYRFENASTFLTARLSHVLEIPVEKLLEFDGATPDDRWKRFKSYNSAYQSKRRKPEPQKWKIVKNGDFWYTVYEEYMEEWKSEFCREE